MAKMLFRLPQAKRVTANPSPEEVKELAAKMRTARPTKYGNLNVQTEVLARSKGSTYLVTDEPDGQNQSVTTDEGAKWAERQDAYIAQHEMVQIDGYIGNDPEFRTPHGFSSRRRTRTSRGCSNSSTSARPKTTSSRS